jgi:hypothetical protein
MVSVKVYANNNNATGELSFRRFTNKQCGGQEVVKCKKDAPSFFALQL